MTDEQTVELLPCPFCGGDPYTRTTQDEDLCTHNIVDWHFVGCINCDVSFGIPDGYDCGTASEQWNTRAEKAEAERDTAWNGAIEAAADLRDEISETIGARPGSSIHSAICEYRNAIRTLMKGSDQ